MCTLRDWILLCHLLSNPHVLTYICALCVGVTTSRHKSQPARPRADRPSSSLPTMWLGSVSGMLVLSPAHECITVDVSHMFKCVCVCWYMHCARSMYVHTCIIPICVYIMYMCACTIRALIFTGLNFRGSRKFAIFTFLFSRVPIQCLCFFCSS